MKSSLYVNKTIARSNIYYEFITYNFYINYRAYYVIELKNLFVQSPLKTVIKKYYLKYIFFVHLSCVLQRQCNIVYWLLIRASKW